MPLFLRKSTIRREPLPITMSGVRMGERVLQLGVDDPRLAATIASKAGMSGQAAMLVSDEKVAQRAQAAAADLGALVDIQIAAPGTLPFPDDAFDVVVVHTRNGFLAALAPETRSTALTEARRVLRQGGRIVVMEPGSPVGMARLFRRDSQAALPEEATGGTIGALNAASFKPVRMLADREGFRFIEGLKT